MLSSRIGTDLTQFDIDLLLARGLRFLLVQARGGRFVRAEGVELAAAHVAVGSVSLRRLVLSVDL